MNNQEAIVRIRDHMIAHKMNEPRAIYISEALYMAIKALEEQTKTGHWINPYGGNWHCDKCDHEQGRKSNFCPNCGARMIESEEV